jgi:L,D-peptidoglycan transpeptidase YkuD (ErfK/YbiS/YcfS/YnhG family)
MIAGMDILVSPAGGLVWQGRQLRAALGRSGISADKREGDGATPIGCFALRTCMFRADRVAAPKTALPLRPIAKDDGWCDASDHAAYNRLVKLPFAASHEELWRTDGLYDVVVDLGYNDDPPVPGRGSAIFLHVARPDYGPTQGCVAVAREDLLWLLSRCDTRTRLCVSAEPPPGL